MKKTRKIPTKRAKKYYGYFGGRMAVKEDKDADIDEIIECLNPRIRLG